FVYAPGPWPSVPGSGSEFAPRQPQPEAAIPITSVSATAATRVRGLTVRVPVVSSFRAALAQGRSDADRRPVAPQPAAVPLPMASAHQRQTGSAPAGLEA